MAGLPGQGMMGPPPGAPGGMGAPPPFGPGPRPPIGALGAPPTPPGAPMLGPMVPHPTPPVQAPFLDLSAAMPPHYQLVDAAVTFLRQAINTGGFYQEPEVLAVIRENERSLDKVVSAYARGRSSEPEAPMSSPRGAQSDSAPPSDESESGDSALGEP